ncbi:MAG: SRPBCC family protein [Terriglobales bacterium]
MWPSASGCRNLHSRSYERGRYSVKQEKGVHAFHRMYAEVMKVQTGMRGCGA